MDEFEYDDDKRKTNLKKHGINLQTAEALWKGPDLLEIQTNTGNERRFLVIGCRVKSTVLQSSRTETREFA